jgi:hypothetical protein
MDPIESVRGALRAILEDIRSQEVASFEQLLDAKRRALAAASDLVADASLSQAEGLTLLREFAVALDSLLRGRWPSLFEPLDRRLTFEDYPPGS